jgi:hypothetical protein
MKTKVLELLVTAIISTPLTALANSDDDKYPATNFQPKVIYADESETSGSSSKSSMDANFPAAHFEPKVLYVDASVTSSTSTLKGEKSVFDPKYPAANFESKIIYP